ncbi:Uncharacterised protein [Mycobacterium tuberculosis]|nr:Uncharacterised protein [Mycobacterium tuberculosis]
METGRNARAASVSASRDCALSSMSAAATLNSSCSTLDAPGMATTPGRLISQASATWAGLASTSTAMARNVASSGSIRRRFSVPNSGFNARTPPGRFSSPYLPPNSPCASGL